MPFLSDRRESDYSSLPGIHTMPRKDPNKERVLPYYFEYYCHSSSCEKFLENGLTGKHFLDDQEVSLVTRQRGNIWGDSERVGRRARARGSERARIY